ncbi:unnamed protein product [Caenorhabditis auriculariae]|uniref:Uncharacterized protein n=1 Tax=Caenorhabditis auriculariae TaxID=2777116 RepID=A0A8S1HQC3_9PELO|nr:unnamed protein product [Caenorhabditis auriculariae]
MFGISPLLRNILNYFRRSIRKLFVHVSRRSFDDAPPTVSVKLDSGLQQPIRISDLERVSRQAAALSSRRMSKGKKMKEGDLENFDEEGNSKTVGADSASPLEVGKPHKKFSN